MKLCVENLSATRGDQTIFAKISFQLQSGEMLVVTGTNGSGKSTLLRVIAGLLPSYTGILKLEDNENNPDHQPICEQCHYLGHQNALKSTMSVGENLLFWQRYCGTPDFDVADSLEMVGLAGTYDIPAAYLSAGQKRRIAIARLLVTKRDIWLVDEPTAALDTSSEAMFADLLRSHLDRGGMVIAATHQPLGLANTKPLNMNEYKPEPVLAAGSNQ